MGILISLHLGRDSRIDSAEGDNERPRPTFWDWQKVANALGRRGLIENDGERLKPTVKGARLIDRCRAEAAGDRDLVERTLANVREIPPDSSPVSLPSPSTIREIERGPFWPWLLAEEL